MGRNRDWRSETTIGGTSTTLCEEWDRNSKLKQYLPRFKNMIENVYIELLKEIYTNSSMTVHLHKESNKINIRRGVRQVDLISPKLFTAALEIIF